jgi:peroxiredoxin
MDFSLAFADDNEEWSIPHCFSGKIISNAGFPRRPTSQGFPRVKPLSTICGVAGYYPGMRWKSTVYFAIVTFVAGLMVYRQITSPERPGEVAVGVPAPDFRIKDESGKAIQLSDYHGKVVLLNFFRTNCEPCIAEMPFLARLNKAFQSRPFQMLIISGDTDWKTVDDFYSRQHLSLPTYLDPGWNVYHQYKLTGTPETFLIGSDGSIMKHVIGARDWTNPSAVAYMNELLGRGDLD